MVSTRGNKYTFSSGERVLCYEPDPSKAKVLYDSKVLDVIVRKDERSKKYVEYLIHFQGWNSSWDRCVSEDYVLKDTEENRKLQKDLADKAQLQLGAYLYRRNRKKRTRTLSQKITESSESGTNSSSSKKSQEEDDDDGEQELATTSDEGADDDDEGNDSSADTDSSLDETIPIDLSDQMKDLLEEDYNLIHHKNKLVTLPAVPTVVEILEGYVKYFGQTQLREQGEPKRRTRGRYREKRETDATKDYEAASAKLNLCKEVVDGLRIYFDFTLGQLLLYDLERTQYEEARVGLRELKREEGIPEVKVEHCDSMSEEDTGQNTSQSGAELHELRIDPDHIKSETETDRKRSLRSHREPAPIVEPSCSISQPCVTPNNGTGKLTIRNLGSLGHLRVSHFSNRDPALSTSSTSSYYSPLLRKVSINSTSNIANVKIAKLIDHNNSWKIVPQSYLDERPHHPATLYGAVHLARLFVKLPNLLHVANQPEKENQPRLLPERKLKALTHHLQLFLTYLEGKREWFGEKHYMENFYQTN